VQPAAVIWHAALTEQLADLLGVELLADDLDLFVQWHRGTVQEGPTKDVGPGRTDLDGSDPGC
jgi:hypothetical protein